MLRRRFVFLFLPLLTFALFLSLTPAYSATSAGPLKAWKLAFVRDGDIWVANGDGTGQKMVIPNGDAPCWSPEKKMIAFAREGNVWVADADGSHQRRLTSRWRDNGPAPMGDSDGSPIDISWEPIDNLITFAHWENFRVAREGSKSDKSIPVCSIYDVPLHPTADQGTEVFFDLTDGGAAFYASENEHPAWAKSGDKMAFVRNGDIWEADRAERQGDKSWAWTHKTWTSWGWEVTRIKSTAGYDAATFRGDRENVFATHLSWSLNGRYLAYGWDGSGYADIDLLDTKNGKSTNLSVWGFDPAFSPDSKMIAYTANGHDDFGRLRQDISVITLDDKRSVTLIENASEPAW